ncbi:hypothetical protein [Luteimonas sp. MC1825]|uniref:hypothetical protein n=1 Tax=Luteimonas sp. MC1825 TaxID=2761107 RepID=UPI00161F058F|nr:hypothetical protein [Luteimonas sp. MC1825]MBB6600269.1 hypothetical protein [Luteimonas sp. MC1825]
MQPLRRADVAPRDRLLARDQQVGLQVGDRTGEGGVIGIATPGFQPVLDGTVAGRRMQPAFAQRATSRRLQLIDRPPRQVHGRRRGGTGGGARTVHRVRPGGGRRLRLAGACKQGRGQRRNR